MTRLLHILTLTAAAVASYYAVSVAVTHGNPVPPLLFAALALAADTFIEDQRRIAAAGRRRIKEEW